MDLFLTAIGARVFDIGIALAFGAASVGVGWLILTRARWQFDSLSEQIVFACGVGVGTYSFALACIGLIGWLYPFVLFGLLAFGIICLVISHASLRAVWHTHWRNHESFAQMDKILLCALALLLMPVCLSAFLPPTDTDAQAYHLVAPALFLQQHAVTPSFHNIGVNYPQGVQILFTIALAAGSDSGAQWIHLVLALMLTVGIYALATRYFSRRVGLWALVIFWSSSLIGLTASSALIDHGLVLFEFLAVYSFLRWRDAHSTRELVLVGAALGMALAIKYLAFVPAGIIGVWVTIETLRASRSPRAMFRNAALVAVIAALVAAPWYLRNWLWLGNPVYPFFTGYYGLNGVMQKPTGALAGLGDWTGMGMGNDLSALLAFPFNVYIHWERFGVVTNRAGPTLFFLLLPLYLFVAKSRVLNWLWLLCGLMFAAWWPLTQNLRYLMIIFPWLAIIAAYIIEALRQKFALSRVRVLLNGLLVSFFVLALLLKGGLLLMLNEGALAFLSGQISRERFLSANVLDYPAMQFMNAQLPPEARVFAIGNSRVYYVKRDLIPDDTHLNWIELAALGKTVDGVAARLQMLGVTHVWLSNGELAYFKTYWNLPTPFEDSNVPFDAFRARHLTLLYHDENDNIVYAFAP